MRNNLPKRGGGYSKLAKSALKIFLRQQVMSNMIKAKFVCVVTSDLFNNIQTGFSYCDVDGN